MGVLSCCPRTGWVDQGQHLDLASAFGGCEIRRQQKRKGGQKFLPPDPLLFCPPAQRSWAIAAQFC